MEPRTYIIACGGTGGHLSPGIALAEALVARGHRATLLISHKKVDTKLVEKYPQFEFLRVPGSGFSLHPVKLIKFIFSQARGLIFSLRLVRTRKPQGVVGFGGFTTTTIIVAAKLAGLPVVLHEANRVPGRAIRLLGPLAKRVYLPPGVRLPKARQSILRPMNLPVRREIVRQSRAEACALFGLEAKQPVVVVLGGSQGASALNQWARTQAETLAQAGVQLYCVTGLGKGEEEVLTLVDRAGAPVKAVFSPFCDRMGALLSAADLVVSRAGAGTIAELVRCVTPAILVPFPHAADNHQQANALAFEQHGGGVVVGQERVSELTKETLEIIFNDWLLRKFRENLQRMDQTHTLSDMVNDLEEITGQRESSKAKEAVSLS